MKVAKYQDLIDARKNIEGVVRTTALRHSDSCSKRAGVDVYLKFENQQKTGSYKIRGAVNRCSYLNDSEKQRGVIASSAGNHAQGVAYASHALKVPATIVMPLNAPIVKVLATRSYGAKVVQFGTIYDEAFEHAQELAKKNNHIFIPPFADPHIIAGQGTVGLEILEQINDIDAIIVPVGGGGLISGIAIAVKELKPSIRIIGVQAEHVSNLQKSYHAGSMVSDPVTKRTIADGIAVKKPNAYMLENYLNPLVDDFYTVSESEMADAMVFLLERIKSLAEASAAASLALAFKKGPELGKKVCCVLTGGNVDLNIISKLIEQGLQKRGRIFRLDIMAPDIPGSLSMITKVIADERANILEVIHDRIDIGLNINETKIEILLETFDFDHIEQIKKSLVKVGARIL